MVNVAVTTAAAVVDDEARTLSPAQMEQFRSPSFRQQRPPGGKPQRPAQKVQAVGTGFIIDASGLIVTNNHVAGKADVDRRHPVGRPQVPGQAARR